jgi:nucleotide-binding universal stress UspA family protein
MNGPGEPPRLSGETEVVLAYDGSAASRQALELACLLAADRGHRMRVIIATRRSPRYSEDMAEAKEALTRAEQAGRRLRNEVEARCQERGITVRTTVRPGAATPELRLALLRDAKTPSLAVVATSGLAAAWLAWTGHRVGCHTISIVSASQSAPSPP